MRLRVADAAPHLNHTLAQRQPKCTLVIRLKRLPLPNRCLSLFHSVSFNSIAWQQFSTEASVFPRMKWQVQSHMIRGWHQTGLVSRARCCGSGFDQQTGILPVFSDKTNHASCQVNTLELSQTSFEHHIASQKGRGDSTVAQVPHCCPVFVLKFSSTSVAAERWKWVGLLLVEGCKQWAMVIDLSRKSGIKYVTWEYHWNYSCQVDVTAV